MARAALVQAAEPGGHLAHHGAHDQRIHAIRRLRRLRPTVAMPWRNWIARASATNRPPVRISPVAEANVRSKQASNERAQADLARMKPLLDKAEISRLQYDSYQAQARVAESELRAAQEQLKFGAEERQHAQSRGGRGAVEGQPGAVPGGRVRWPIASRWMCAAPKPAPPPPAWKPRVPISPPPNSCSATPRSSAPADGVVTRKSVEPGQIVQPGQSLMTVIQLQDVWVTANFKETQLAQVRAGQRAEIHVDMYGKSVEGHVDSIAGATGSRLSLLPAENATGNFVKVVQRIPVKILVDSQ